MTIPDPTEHSLYEVKFAVASVLKLEELRIAIRHRPSGAFVWAGPQDQPHGGWRMVDGGSPLEPRQPRGRLDRGAETPSLQLDENPHDLGHCLRLHPRYAVGMFNPDAPQQDPHDFVGSHVNTPRGRGYAFGFRGIYVTVRFGGTAVRLIHWAHCQAA